MIRKIKSYIEHRKFDIIMNTFYAIKDREFKEFIEKKETIIAKLTEIERKEIEILCNRITTNIIRWIHEELKHY